MKALSIREPWASMITDGRKTIETRNWKTNHRGLLAIHRSGPGGAIVAVADVEEIEVYTPAHRIRAFGGMLLPPSPRYSWFLTHIVSLPCPIPIKGMLGLWDIPEAEAQMVLDQILPH